MDSTIYRKEFELLITNSHTLLWERPLLYEELAVHVSRPSLQVERSKSGVLSAQCRSKKLIFLHGTFSYNRLVYIRFHRKVSVWYSVAIISNQ